MIRSLPAKRLDRGLWAWNGAPCYLSSTGAAIYFNSPSCVFGFAGLHVLINSITLVQSSAVPPLLARICDSSFNFKFFTEGWHMTRSNSWAFIALTMLLALPLAACKDTKTLQENEQLKSQVAQLQKDNGQAVNDLESMTAERDTLTKENEQLKAELKALKAKKSGKKSATRRHHHS
ncbi:MAG TPA: hypothetical protein VFI38_08435 [Candidatus Acidoferrum sp.]|nr:hypothetical protein [Candidatus Acidoferrum sp.]